MFIKKNYIFNFKSILYLLSNCISRRTLNQYLNMKDCLITYLINSEYGCAIYISHKEVSLNINDTTFYECISTNGQGGAIFFFF